MPTVLAPAGKFWRPSGYGSVPLETMDAPSLENIHNTDLKHVSFPCPCPKQHKKGGGWVKPRTHTRSDCLRGYALKSKLGTAPTRTV